MKIKIGEMDRNFTLLLPNRLVFSGLTARIACFALEKKVPGAAGKLTEGAMKTIFSEIKRLYTQHGEWVLVEVQSAGGEHIEIIL